jgi:hypothetical protein
LHKEAIKKKQAAYYALNKQKIAEKRAAKNGLHQDQKTSIHAASKKENSKDKNPKRRSMHALNPDQGATNEFVNGQSPIKDKLSIYSNKTRKQSTAKITSNDNTVNKHIEQLRGQKIKQTFRMNKICRNRPTPETVQQRATDKMQNSNNYDRRHRILIRQQLAV